MDSNDHNSENKIEKRVRRKNQDIGPAAETLVADYIDSNSFDNMTSYVSNLQYRDHRKSIADLKARQAVDMVSEMRYYKGLHKDYSDYDFDD